jgi:hypothetical protein
MSNYSKTEYKPYPDSGSLRASATKKGPKSPDYWGDIAINLKDLTNVKTVDGLTVVKLSGWKKVDKQGKTYLSIAVDRFVPNAQGGVRQENQAQQFSEDDSDIPF